MDPKNTKALLQKLTPTMARGMEAAAGACIQRTHFEISVEHLLLKLLDLRRGDVAKARNVFVQLHMHDPVLLQSMHFTSLCFSRFNKPKWLWDWYLINQNLIFR